MVNIVPYTINELESLDKEEYLLLDCRPSFSILEDGFIPNSIFYDSSQDNKWMKIIFDEYPKVIIINSGRDASQINLVSANKDLHIVGYLQGGFESYKDSHQKLDYIIEVGAEEIDIELKHGEPNIVDIRSVKEYNEGHVKDADQMSPIDFFFNVDILPNKEIFYLYDHSEECILTILTLLKKHGFHNYYGVQGGYVALLSQGLEMHKSTKVISGIEYLN